MLTCRYLTCPDQNDSLSSCKISKPYFDPTATGYLVKVSANNPSGSVTSDEVLIETKRFS